MPWKGDRSNQRLKICLIQPPPRNSLSKDQQWLQLPLEKPEQHTRKAISANCEDQKTGDVNVSAADKGSAEDAVCL